MNRLQVNSSYIPDDSTLLRTIDVTLQHAAVKCPVPDWQYETYELEPVVVAALLTTHSTVHSAAAGAIVSAKVEKVKRPTVASAGSSEDWTYFVSRWKDYIQATKVSGKDLVIQLLECCDETLRRDITRSAGGSLVDKSEQEVLAAMRTLAVKEENTMVARVSLHGMTQDCDETVRSFGVRLRGQRCQSCLAGIKVLYKIGLTKRDLIPVNMQMHAANNKGIVILEAVILRLSGKDQYKNELETRQIVYSTDSADKFFLSKEACITLGIISENFPTIGEITGSVTDTSALTNDQNRFTTQIDCNCPKRQSPPPTPVKLPFPPTEENVPKLQNFLPKHYKSITFNNCEHQPLSLMEGPPLKLMEGPPLKHMEATPVACHTPVPIFLHWDDDVKASLDQDVRLGVIEPIPVGEPYGKSRIYVDFQALNALAIRETHHTQSPFHQSGSVTRGKKKTVFDAWNGYYSVPIRDEDRYFTTVITPWGRYRYKTATQGYIASGDGYTRRFDEIVADVPHRTKCVDDTLLWSDDIEESFVQA
ncbi:Hypothetical predicted protein, partial [Mytilus galloprovincialis]